MIIRKTAKHVTARGIFVLILVVSAVLFLFTAPASAKTKSVSFWDAANESNPKKIDHSAWQQQLDGYLRVHSAGINKFDYAALKKNARDRAKLESYLEYLQKTDPRDYSRTEQKAYWINFYNALTVKVVADAFPVKSILEICEDRVSGSQCSGPWKEVRAKVAGRGLTLGQHRKRHPPSHLERQPHPLRGQLRKLWDVRIFFRRLLPGKTPRSY